MSIIEIVRNHFQFDSEMWLSKKTKWSYDRWNEFNTQKLLHVERSDNSKKRSCDRKNNARTRWNNLPSVEQTDNSVEPTIWWIKLKSIEENLILECYKY